MIINNNIGAMNAHRQMGANQEAQGNSMEKLSSGLRINRAGDDAAGLAISEKMRGQIRGLEQADRNAQDGVSMIQTAEGALNESHSILQRMRELSVQSANDTNTESDRQELQKEFDQLGEEIDRISGQTEFNTQKLLSGGEKSVITDTASAQEGELSVESGIMPGDVNLEQTNTYASDDTLESVEFTIDDGNGSKSVSIDAADVGGTDDGAAVELNGVSYRIDASGVDTSDGTEGETDVGNDDFSEDSKTGIQDASFTFQIGANDDQNIELSINKMSTDSLGANGNEISELVSDEGETNGALTSQESANKAIESLDAAIQQVSAERSQLGASQNRLEHTINNLGTSAENLQSAESRIRDVDMAKEMMDNTKNNILSQASQSMLAQANQQPQQVLQLLQ
ncbi:flagellin N-terminal helical domain-containing protein [Marinococcus luteus]|uniref:flagellin N-terminal helical domain-containing protein n=1 Tax=Marinococcus luteus TaxID=1122204 RepID=UPI002ACC7F3A|nr:flagellin [Marinococcus luteus]MDZ5784096.1 flagellin [Marinococcus luteus]